MRLHLAETKDFSPQILAELQSRFTVTTGSVAENDLPRVLREVDIFWFRLGYRINAQCLSAASRCRYLVTPVTGIDHIDEKLCAALDVKIICLRGETTFLREVRATAEHTIFLAMALMRKAVPAAIDANNGQWRRDLFRGFELYGKRIGIVGYGRLGSIVAEYLHRMGCQIGAYEIAERDFPDYVTRYSTLQECISQSNIVSLHVPYNEDTHHLLDEKILGYFDADTWLINTSRGGIVDETALLAVLEKQQIAGVATDVLYGEPLITNHPLITYAQQHNNLLITPHIGGCTYESFAKTEAFVARKLFQQLQEDGLQ